MKTNKKSITPSFMKQNVPAGEIKGTYDWKKQRGITCSWGTSGTTNGPTAIPGGGSASDSGMDSWND